MNDVELYSSQTGLYDQIQDSRPDYSKAIDKVVGFAVEVLKGKESAVITDFCCGTGRISKVIAEKLGGVEKVNLIDINSKFLEIAKDSGIQTKTLLTSVDILEAKVVNEADVVLAVFAYHHVVDEKKNEFLQKAKEALKFGGYLILAEIYMPDREITIEYYKELYKSVPEEKKSEELHDFLMQTARSQTFEFKVSKEFAHNQIKACGFKLIESDKIWPTNNSLGEDVGTYVELWQLA
jgi:ubiquinone/menaquinone biosynthesis C-methylase UbiE